MDATSTIQKNMNFQLVFSQMTHCLVERGIFESQPFSLLDVGSSGGIANFWRVFGSSLTALGIDPIIKDCQQLNSEETSPTVGYRAAWIGLPDHHPFIQQRGPKDPWGRNPWNRLSGPWATKILKPTSNEKEKLYLLDIWQEEELIDPRSKIGVDELVQEEKLINLDFIKIDIDGHDMEVILSSEKTCKNSPVLGFSLEVNFYGSPAESDHTFHNTDKLMREWGFDLFDLTIKRYSTAALPAPFEWDGPAETTFGRPYQGEALYLRDPMAKGTPGCPEFPDLSAHKLLKLACLFECFGLPDHAAEILKGHAHLFDPLIDSQELLNILAIEVNPSVKSYAEYMDKFISDPTSFYLSNRANKPRKK